MVTFCRSILAACSVYSLMSSRSSVVPMTTPSLYGTSWMSPLTDSQKDFLNQPDRLHAPTRTFPDSRYPFIPHHPSRAYRLHSYFKKGALTPLFFPPQHRCLRGMPLCPGKAGSWLATGFVCPRKGTKAKGTASLFSSCQSDGKLLQ